MATPAANATVQGKMRDQMRKIETATNLTPISADCNPDRIHDRASYLLQCLYQGLAEWNGRAILDDDMLNTDESVCLLTTWAFTLAIKHIFKRNAKVAVKIVE